MARGVDGRAVFIDDTDRRNFLNAIRQLKFEMPHTLLAYCLMGNHFHVAIKVGGSSLSRIMQRLLTCYVVGFNARHGREGHLFQARYKSFLCLDDVYLIELIRYIHMNPVRAGMAANPSDWPWSSHRQYAGKTSEGLVDSRLFFEAASAWEPAARDYERWSGNPNGDFKPWPKEEVPASLLREESKSGDSLDELALDLFPDDLIALRSGERKRSTSKKKAIVAARAIQNGHTLASIAAWMGCTPPAISHLLRRNK